MRHVIHICHTYLHFRLFNLKENDKIWKLIQSKYLLFLHFSLSHGQNCPLVFLFSLTIQKYLENNI